MPKIVQQARVKARSLTWTLTLTQPAIQAARAENGKEGYFSLDSPASCERIRMACCDDMTAFFTTAEFKANGCW